MDAVLLATYPSADNKVGHGAHKPGIDIIIRGTCLGGNLNIVEAELINHTAGSTHRYHTLHHRNHRVCHALREDII